MHASNEAKRKDFSGYIAVRGGNERVSEKKMLNMLTYAGIFVQQTPD